VNSATKHIIYTTILFVLLYIKYVLKTAPPRCMVVWWFTHKVLLNNIYVQILFG